MMNLRSVSAREDTIRFDGIRALAVLERRCPQFEVELTRTRDLVILPVTLAHMEWHEYNPLSVIQVSDSTTVKVEVPREWRFWSGWTDGRVWNKMYEVWIEGKDVMDEENFDEDAAFPRLKPNLEVLQVGSPNYTRKQRGWYHIRPWPPSLPGTMSAAPGTGRHVTGADIPPELFDIIIKHIGFHEGAVALKKRELGRIALVCRRWADILQGKIFEKITLRSREDFVVFSSLISHPQSRIPIPAQRVELLQPLTQYPLKPWVHTLPPSQLLRSEEWSRVFCMVLSGPLPPRKSTRSIWNMIPTMSPLSYRGIYELELRNLHVGKLGDLIRIPRELPSLTQLTLWDVTWEEWPDKETSAFPVQSCVTRKVSGTDYIATRLRRCTDNVAAVWFSSLLATRRRDQLELHEAHQVCRMASAFVQGIDKVKFSDYGVTSMRYVDSIHFFATHEGHKLTPEVTVYITPRVIGLNRHLRAIRINFYFTTVFEAIGHADWQAVDACIAALPTVETILATFLSNDDVILFHETVVQKIPNLTHLKKAKYASRTLVGQYPGDNRATGFQHVSCSGNEVHAAGQLFTPGVKDDFIDKGRNF
ncbi:hypothetical protein NM688_g6821 [Phlebia brevispora]|uniref:Uncharacterized protein n=1 Tax=Phlebia brevispora TaxID=194682 RepID=A0ACC1SC39_9APHY|nr:hypothetical protein NM688_g6821 [Phlebia brevispora]